MPSIGIADKVTLDAIKTELDELLTNRLTAVRAANLDSKSFHKVLFSTTQGTLQTALNVSGSGELYLVSIGFSAQTTYQIKATVDGIVIFEFNNTTGVKLNIGYSTQSINNIFGLINTSDSLSPLKLPFNNNLKIEIKSDGTNTMYCNIGYVM